MKKPTYKIILAAALIAVFLFLGNNAQTQAQTNRRKIVRFAPGKSSIVLKGAVMRGTSNRYVIAAEKGQTMSVKINSLEKNANFTVYFAGEQESLGAEDTTVWIKKLFDDNNYVIIVSATRGNAAYNLTVAVK